MMIESPPQSTSTVVKKPRSPLISVLTLRNIILGVNSIILLLSIIIMGYGGYAAENREIVASIGKYPGVLAALCGAFIFLVTIFGCFGAAKLNRCLLITYAVFMFLLAIILIAMGGTLISFRKTLTDSVSNQCASRELQFIQDTEVWESELQEFYEECLVTYSNLYSRVQDCPGYSAKFGSSDKASLLEYLEENYSCSGFCTIREYMFSGRLGNGTTPCAIALANAVETNADKAGGAFLAIGIIFEFLILAVSYLSFHPQRTRYSQMLST
eukprot:GILJ01002535.1.p1 GENE.GILJ01002535.1~~GILJ01002535.1.p1  ORF type:complete len:270 (-),score=20.34 GILJ01002535.1:315-1124(-)